MRKLFNANFHNDYIYKTFEAYMNFNHSLRCSTKFNSNMTCKIYTFLVFLLNNYLQMYILELQNYIYYLVKLYSTIQMLQFCIYEYKSTIWAFCIFCISTYSQKWIELAVYILYRIEQMKREIYNNKKKNFIRKRDKILSPWEMRLCCRKLIEISYE